MSDILTHPVATHSAAFSEVWGLFQLVLVKGWGITVVEQGLKNPPQHEILSSNCVQSRLVLNTNNPIRLSFLQILFHQNTKEIIQMYIIYLADLKSMYMYLNMNIIYCMNPI